MGADLSGAGIINADFTLARLSSASFRKSILAESTFIGADLEGTDFTGAHLENVDFSRTDLSKAIGLTIEQLSKVKTLAGALLSSDLEKEVEEKYPSLLVDHG